MGERISFKEFISGTKEIIRILPIKGFFIVETKENDSNNCL